MADSSTWFEKLTTWQARSWQDLRSIWDALGWRDDSSPSPSFDGQALRPQEAGLVFERLVIEAFRLGGAVVHYPFPIMTQAGDMVRGQNDGLILDGWRGFLVQSKFEKGPIDIDPFYRLHVLVEHRPVGTIGLLVSFNGFTPPANETANLIKPIRVLMFEKVDLAWGMGSQERMMEMVRRKMALAMKYGSPHQPIARSVEDPNSTADEDRGPMEIPTGFIQGEVDHDDEEVPAPGGKPS